MRKLLLYTAVQESNNKYRFCNSSLASPILNARLVAAEVPISATHILSAAMRRPIWRNDSTSSWPFSSRVANAPRVPTMKSGQGRMSNKSTITIKRQVSQHISGCPCSIITPLASTTVTCVHFAHHHSHPIIRLPPNGLSRLSVLLRLIPALRRCYYYCHYRYIVLGCRSHHCWTPIDFITSSPHNWHVRQNERTIKPKRLTKITFYRHCFYLHSDNTRYQSLQAVYNQGIPYFLSTSTLIISVDSYCLHLPPPKAHFSLSWSYFSLSWHFILFMVL